MRPKQIVVSKPFAFVRQRSPGWGALSRREAEVLPEFLQRFITICPDDGGKTDPADKKRIRAVKRILCVE